MSTFYAGAAAFLMLNLLVGLFAVWRGPGTPDRVLAVQLTGTLGIGVALLLGAGGLARAAVDLAVVLAVLAAVTTVVFARLGRFDGGAP